ncbi:polyprenyl synthetase family protein [Desulfobacca acetoxidans]|uniref:Trans-hexaprenyltranstransferase n=1 Tax=Desulfobacca acetoxidans (strain ATCC 700848 / DSM 11109 / ASRB2) TaxID=880072 RepID=F2NHQ6_DESAR|nr:polyprenyl synthetase family protein [Desulfobacca acetoxidans]AEB09391.1 Trans-hexaprenyltranstransferase [Desulfobacca acetoxidans DSM 11109]
MKLRHKMILQRLQPDIDRINLALSGNLATHVRLISEVWDHILISGGKRIRPLLFILAARMCGCRGDHLPDIGAIFEYLHAATLLHDDVVDAATERRGQSSANTIWGNQAVILVGDFLLSKALSIAVETRQIRIIEVLAQTTTYMAEGEVLQLVNTGRLEMTEEEYFDVITRKTAKLMSAACQIGAILGGVDGRLEAAMADFGLNLGITFQLIDDILDFTGNAKEMGKPICNDLKEGKITLPFIHTLRQLGPTEQQSLGHLVRESDAARIAQELLPLMQRHGSIDYARRLAQEYTNAAKENLALFPSSPEKSLFLEVTDILVNRTF